MTLLADIRVLTNTTTSDVSDAYVQMALDNNRIFYDAQPVAFHPYTNTSGSVVYKRGRIGGWGWFDISTGTAGYNTGGTIANSTGGTSIGSWNLAEDGWIDFQTDQKGTALFFSGYAYDRYAAAVEVLEAHAANKQLEYRFSTDGQSFDTQQQLDMIHKTADRYRQKMLARSGVLVRVDEARGVPATRAVRVRDSY